MKEPNWWYFEDSDREYFFNEFSMHPRLRGYFQNAMPLSDDDCKAISALLSKPGNGMFFLKRMMLTVKPAQVVYVAHHESESAFPALESEWESGRIDDGNCLPVSYESYLDLCKEWGL